MKKVKYLSLILIAIFTTNVYALSAPLSASTASVYVGDTFTIYVRMNGAAAWEIHVSSSGPASGCTIDEADSDALAQNTSKTFSATCTATAEGNVTVTLSGNITDEDGNTVDLSGTNVVRASKRPAAPSNPAPSSQTPSTSTPSYSQGGRASYSPAPSTSTNNNQTNTSAPANVESTETKSTDNRLKSINVDNYKIEKVDDNNYKLTINNNIDSIVIKAEAMDTKAKLEGAGKKSIKVGENNIQIKVISESGAENIYNLKVIRKDAFYLDDLKALLNDKNISQKNVIITKNDKLTKADLNLIKESKSTVYLNYVDNEKNNIYTWILDGDKLKFNEDFLTTVTYGNSTNKELLKASNYANGITVTFGEGIPSGSTFRLYLKNAYDKTDKPNLYFYNTAVTKFELINKNINLNERVIDINNPNKGDYLISLSKISDAEEKVSSGVNYYLVSIILAITLLLFILFHLIRGIRNSKKIRSLKNELTKEIEIPKEEVEVFEEPSISEEDEEFNAMFNINENAETPKEVEPETNEAPPVAPAPSEVEVPLNQEDKTNLLNSDVVKPVSNVTETK